MNAGGRVVILAGGLSHERDVSLRSGRRVADALRDEGVEVLLRDLDPSLIQTLRADRPDVVLPLLHGAPGEDGSLRRVLDLLDLPYLGSDAMASRTAFDKPTASEMVARAGVAVPASVVLPRPTFTDLGARPLLDSIVDHVGLPLVVKPSRGGSSLGVSMVQDEHQLASAMVTCFSYGEEAVLQRFVAGQEIAVCVVERDGTLEALPLVEIDPDGRAYDYEARYTAGETTFYVPARLEDEVAERARATGVTAHRALGLRHLSRTDLIVDEAGVPWFLEVNVAPGMTETSTFPQAIAASGQSTGKLMMSLLRDAQASKSSEQRF